MLLMSVLSLSNAAVAHTGWHWLRKLQGVARGLPEVVTAPVPSPEIEAKYNKKMQVLRDELDLRRKTEIHEVEERKNSQISELMRNHEKAFSDIKNYYNDITLKNLALITLLKVLPVPLPGLQCHPATKGLIL